MMLSAGTLGQTLLHHRRSIRLSYSGRSNRTLPAFGVQGQLTERRLANIIKVPSQIWFIGCQSLGNLHHRMEALRPSDGLLVFWNVGAQRHQREVTVEGEAGMRGEPVDVDVHKMNTTVKAVKLVVEWRATLQVPRGTPRSAASGNHEFPLAKMDGMVPLQPSTSDQSRMVPVRSDESLTIMLLPELWFALITNRSGRDWPRAFARSVPTQSTFVSTSGPTRSFTTLSHRDLVGKAGVAAFRSTSFDRCIFSFSVRGLSSLGYFPKIS